MPRVVWSRRPAWWPRFISTLRSTAVTARLGLVLGIAVGICLLTGLLNYFQYQLWAWLPPPASPVWGYHVTQGVHVATRRPRPPPWPAWCRCRCAVPTRPGRYGRPVRGGTQPAPSSHHRGH